MPRTLIVFVFMIVWSAITLFAFVWGFRYNWPDFVHVDYGLPLTWGTNTLSTIVGPADTWTVNIQNLLVNLVFWLAIMIAAVTALVYKIKR
jgi:hypothetical protein